jgi:carboxyl-terminal processing protease
MHPSDAQPGVAARPAAFETRPAVLPASTPTSSVVNVTLRREPVALASVRSAKLTLGGVPLGYIRLDTFSGTSAAETRRAVQDLVKGGVKGFVLDLRDNPGGLVDAGARFISALL